MEGRLLSVIRSSPFASCCLKMSCSFSPSEPGDNGTLLFLMFKFFEIYILRDIFLICKSGRRRGEDLHLQGSESKYNNCKFFESKCTKIRKLRHKTLGRNLPRVQSEGNDKALLVSLNRSPSSHSCGGQRVRSTCQQGLFLREAGKEHLFQASLSASGSLLAVGIPLASAASP